MTIFTGLRRLSLQSSLTVYLDDHKAYRDEDTWKHMLEDFVMILMPEDHSKSGNRYLGLGYGGV